MISDETMYGHVIYKRMKKSRFLKGLQNIFLNFFFVCLFVFSQIHLTDTA